MKFVDILYVDDNKLNRFIVEKQLRPHFSVRVLSSGAELYEVLEQTLPRVILLDWMMPEKSGLEVLKDLRSQPRFRGLIIIMLTARASKDDMVLCLSAGANDYIVKPPHYPELIARIKALLRQRRAEDQIRMRNQIQSYEALLRGLTHEFNNIFSAFRLSLQMYERKGPEYFDKRLDDLKDLMVRGTSLVDDLRRFRIDPKDEWRELDLREVLEQANHDFERNLEIEDSPVRMQPLPSERVTVHGNSSELIQVFLNLLDNARKAIAGQDGGYIEVSLEELGDVIKVGIADNGKGIDPEIIENLDNLFFSSDSAENGPTSRMLPGSGLGLPTCKRLLAAHEANMQIQSTAETGTRILIEFVKNPQMTDHL